MGLFDLFKKKEKSEVKTNINAVSHVKCGVWHQYDILLSGTIYGWEYILNWADYMAASDMKQIDLVSLADPGSGDINITGEFEQYLSIKNMPSVMEEHSTLGLAGTGNMSRGPIKIVWFNQTKMLRIFITTRNDEFILKYVDTMVKRNFGTKDQMKLLATDIKVEDLILAASGEFVKQTTVKKKGSVDISADPEKYDAYLKKAASRITIDDKKKIISLIESDQKILAVKICKETTGEGLKAAKDLIDNYERYITV